jgi:hypothetical protein
MLTGPLVRKRKNQKRYKQYSAIKTPGCDFCAFNGDTEHLQQEYKHFWVVNNMFGYDVWDGVDVLEHLLVVPKRHVDSIGHFTPAESKEYMAVISQYEQTGYSLYSRAPQNITKSVVHQHTHLIKLGTKKARALLYINKPHYLGYF